MSSLHPLFSRCDPAGRRPAKLSIEELHRNKSCCAQRTIDSALHRRRKQIGRRFERPERACKTTGSRRVQRPLADFAEPPQSKRCNLLRRNSAVFCARSGRTAVRSRQRCPADTFGATFWCQKVVNPLLAGNAQSEVRDTSRSKNRFLLSCIFSSVLLA